MSSRNMINTQSYTVYRRDDPRRRQKPSSYTTGMLDQPKTHPVPNPNRKVGVKRKSHGVSQVLCDPKPDPTSKPAKRTCVKPKPRSKPVEDPLLSLKHELRWMRQQEMKPYMRVQPWLAGELLWKKCDVTKQQRADLIEWLMVAHLGLHLEENTLFVAINLLDRCMQQGRVTKKALKPIALSCLWIASKMSDQYHRVPKEWLLVKLLGPSQTVEDFHTCERMVLRAVGFHIWSPTALQFAEKYVSLLEPRLVGAIRGKLHSALELCLRDSKMSHKNPSEVGISALSYALGLETDAVAAKLKDISGYDIHQLHDKVVRICNLAYYTYQLEDADPIFNKYPKAFVLADNIYLRFRAMACKK